MKEAWLLRADDTEMSTSEEAETYTSGQKDSLCLQSTHYHSRYREYIYIYRQKHGGSILQRGSLAKDECNDKFVGQPLDDSATGARKWPFTETFLQ